MAATTRINWSEVLDRGVYNHPPRLRALVRTAVAAADMPVDENAVVDGLLDGLDGEGVLEAAVYGLCTLVAVSADEQGIPLGQ